MIRKGKLCMWPVVHTAGAYIDFCNVHEATKSISTSSFPLDGMLVHHMTTPPSFKFTATHLYT